MPKQPGRSVALPMPVDPRLYLVSHWLIPTYDSEGGRCQAGCGGMAALMTRCSVWELACDLCQTGKHPSTTHERGYLRPVCALCTRLIETGYHHGYWKVCLVPGPGHVLDVSRDERCCILPAGHKGRHDNERGDQW